MKNTFCSRSQILIFILLITSKPIDISSQGMWEPISSPVASNITNMIGTKNGVLFIAMPYSGIQYSLDHGESWQFKNEGLNEFTKTILMAAAEQSEVYLANENKLYKLSDIKDDWKLTNYSGPKISKLYAGVQNKLFCVSGKQVFMSSDGGSSFSLYLTSPIMYGEITDFSYNGNDQNFFVDGMNKSTLYKFNDSGIQLDSLAHYTNTLTNLLWHPNGTLFVKSDSKNKIYNELTHQLKDYFQFPPSTQRSSGYLLKDEYDNLLSQSTPPYLSIDGGNTWRALANIKWPQTYYEYNFNKNICFLDKQIFISSNDCQLPTLDRYDHFDADQNDLSGIISLPSVFSIISDTTGNLIVSKCQYQYNKFSFFNIFNPKINKWNPLKVNGEDVLAIKKSSFNRYYAICINKTYYSDDFGTTWDTLKTKLKGYQLDIVISPLKELFFVGAHDAIGKSNSEGSDFKWIQTVTCCDGIITQIFFHPNGRIYLVYSNEYMLFSDDRGETFNSYISFDYFSGPKEMNAIGDIFTLGPSLYTIDYDLKKQIYIDTFGVGSKIVGIDKTDKVFVYDPKKGLFQCNKQGCKPFEMTGLPYPHSFVRTIYEDDQHYLYAGMLNDQIYKYSKPFATQTDHIKPSDQTFIIYPNPFSGNVHLAFNASRAKNNHIVIENLSGVVFFEALTIDVNLNIETSLWPSGIYVIQVNNKEFKKLVKL